MAGQLSCGWSRPTTTDVCFFSYIFLHYGPLHVLWQVSFCCWVTWSISSWQEYYKSVFFPKWMKWIIKFTIIPKKLFGTWQYDFIIQKLKICKIEKEDALLILLSAWDTRYPWLNSQKKPVKGHIEDLKILHFWS